MKKFFALLLAVVMVATLFCGCNTAANKANTIKINLAENPINNKEVAMNGKYSLTVEFTLAQAGYLKLIAYDNTAYDVMPDGINKSKLVLKNNEGKQVAEYKDINGGFYDAVLFEAGVVTAEISFDKNYGKIEEAYIEWGFAPDSDEAQIIKGSGEITAAKTDKNKEAQFVFEALEDGLYQINCGELCNFETNCKFDVQTASGIYVAKDLTIHETEWYFRNLFLARGKYTITAKGIDSVARCTVKLHNERYYNILTAIPEKVVLDKAPIAFGIMYGEKQQIKATITVTDDSDRLRVMAEGINSYYDSQQTYDIVVTNSSGRKLVNETNCEPNMWMFEKKGNYNVTITVLGNGVYSLEMMNTKK